MAKAKKVPKKKAPHRPLKYGEPTKGVLFKLPISKIAAVRKLVYDYLKQFERS
jgi:hypothetical protein